MKRVLVTGASGFIGRHCLHKLKARGYDVHAVSRDARQAPSQYAHWHTADLLDLTCIPRLMEDIRPTHLLHLAWHVAPGSWASSGGEQYLRWVQSSLELLIRFTEISGNRVVMAGSCTEYDWQFDGACSETATPLKPNTLYGVCKNALQQQFSKFCEEVGLSSAWGRVFFLYGPFENKARLVPSVINAILSGEAAHCTSGTQIRDFLYVEDVADAFVALMDSDLRGPVNIASGQPVALMDVIYAIADKLGSRDLVRLGSRPMPANETPLVAADISRLSDELGWKPQYDLDSGLNKTITWWKDSLEHNDQR